MTLHEIENTLHSLEQRHENLDEGMLLTLLRASGWEEKEVQEALVLFKSSPKNLADDKPIMTAEKEQPNVTTGSVSVNNTQTNTTVTNTTPESIVYYNDLGQEEKDLKAVIDDGKDIPVIKDVVDTSYTQPRVTTQDSVIPAQTQPTEPQSLVVEQQKQTVKPTVPAELPNDLPLKPFESTEHVWPLSRYKEVFHGESSVPPILSREESALVESHKDAEQHKKIKMKRTGFDGEDEGLILMTGFSLFVILVLLAYMYSNGRL